MTLPHSPLSPAEFADIKERRLKFIEDELVIWGRRILEDDYDKLIAMVEALQSAARVDAVIIDGLRKDGYADAAKLDSQTEEFAALRLQLADLQKRCQEQGVKDGNLIISLQGKLADLKTRYRTATGIDPDAGVEE